MAIGDKIRDEELQYDKNREPLKFQHYEQVKFISMSNLQAKKYYLLIKVDRTS